MKLLHLLLLLPLLHHLHLPLPLLQPFRPRFVPPFGAGVGGAAAQLSNVDLQLARERLKFRLARERRKFRRARDRLKLELARERLRFRYRYRGQRSKGSYSAPQPSTRKNLEKEEGSVRKKRDRRRGRRRGKWRKSVSRPSLPREPTSLGEFKQLLRLYVASLSAPSGAPTGAPTEIPSPDPPTNSTKCPSPT